jgi:hypothetical protein
MVTPIEGIWTSYYKYYSLRFDLQQSKQVECYRIQYWYWFLALQIRNQKRMKTNINLGYRPVWAIDVIYFLSIQTNWR